MFPTQKLFKDDLCPNYTACYLFNCIYSHTPSTPLVGVRTHSISSTSTTSNSIISHSINPAVKRSGTALESNSASKITKIEPNSGSSNSNAVASTSKVQLPQTVTSQRVLVDTGPPRITTSGSTHTAFSIRQKMLTLTYEHFLLSYTALPDPNRAIILAGEHAKEQELNVYNKSNKANYRNSIISTLTRIKKRPLPVLEKDTGTLEEEASRLKAAEEKEKGKLTKEKIKKYISTKEILFKYDYVVELPEGDGGDLETEEGYLRKCDRCGKDWMVKGILDDFDKTACSFHYGKMITEKLGGIKQRVFSCCPAPGTAPCSTGPHVFADKSIDKLHSRIPFVQTSSLISVQYPSKSKLDIVALDCELIYTTSGMALARLTVIDENGSVILDEKIIPQGSILDRNVRYSGVQEKDIEEAVMDLRAVREALGDLISEETVIVGHGVENDLKALRLVHLNVIDTAIIFPHPRGMPWRHALRNLTRDILGKFIQDGDPSLGHSSVDDSQAALELLRWKVRQDFGTK